MCSSDLLRISGKVAQFGRGIMGDVSEKLMAQFAQNLNTMLDAEADDPAEAAALVAEAVAHQQEVDEHAATTSSEPQTPPTSGVRKIQGPAAAPIELSNVAGSAMLKRLLPLVGGAVIVLFVLRRLLK